MGGYWFDDKNYHQLVMCAVIEELIGNGSTTMTDILYKAVPTSFKIQDDAEVELQTIQWFDQETHN